MMKQFASSGGSCHWFCNVCDPKAIDVLRMVQQVRDKNCELDTRLTSVESKVEKIDREFDERVTVSVRAVVREEVYEAKLRDERKMNIVVKNLPEEKSDKIAFGGIAKVLGLKPEAVEGVTLERVGTQKDGRPRPLRVQCNSSQQRRDILSNSMKLSHVEAYKKVFISRDLTKAEQKQQKELRDELREKRS